MLLIGSRMRRLRKELKLSQEELASLAGVSRASITKWENDKVVPDTGNINSIARALHTSVHYLMGETDNPAQANAHNELVSNIKPLPNGNLVQSIIEVPVISNRIVSGSCGKGTPYAEDVEWESDSTYPVSVLDVAGYTWQGCNFFIITAEGASMEPHIHDGDKVLCVRCCDVGVGDIAVVSIDKKLFIKGILRITDNKITLRAFNRSDYGDFEAEFGEYCDTFIVGKVLKVVSSRDVPNII